MQTKVPFSTYAIIGTMLFGMFFGAGNLIFPIELGQMAGTQILVGFNWFPSYSNRFAVHGNSSNWFIRK